MALGVGSAFVRAPRLGRNHEAALNRSAELIGWLLEQERAQAEGVTMDEPDPLRGLVRTAKAQS